MATATLTVPTVAQASGATDMYEVFNPNSLGDPTVFTPSGDTDAGACLTTIGDGKTLVLILSGFFGSTGYAFRFRDNGTIPAAAIIDSVQIAITASGSHVNADNMGVSYDPGGSTMPMSWSGSDATLSGTYVSPIMSTEPGTSDAWTRARLFGSDDPFSSDFTGWWQSSAVAGNGIDAGGFSIDAIQLLVTYHIGALTVTYPDQDEKYDLGAEDPVLRRYDGQTDRIVAQIPKTGSVIAKAIVSTLAANGKLYLSTFDTGTTAGGTVKGSVYEFDPATNVLTKLGATFPTGHLPYSLCWAMGRIWCGTAVNTLATATPGRIYWFRPGQDTAWTLEKTFAASESIVSGLEVYKGAIYASLLYSSTGAGTGKVVVRSTTGVWSSSDTGTIGTDATGVARGYYSLLTWPREDGAQRSPTPKLYAVRKGISGESGYVIRRYDGSSWSSVYTAGAGGPDLAASYAVNASGQVVPVIFTANGISSLLNSVDGSSWTERIAQVSIEAGPLCGLLVQR
jgi:hypothetical protein